MYIGSGEASDLAAPAYIYFFYIQYLTLSESSENCFNRSQVIAKLWPQSGRSWARSSKTTRTSSLPRSTPRPTRLTASPFRDSQLYSSSRRTQTRKWHTQVNFWFEGRCWGWLVFGSLWLPADWQVHNLLFKLRIKTSLGWADPNNVMIGGDNAGLDRHGEFRWKGEKSDQDTYVGTPRHLSWGRFKPCLVPGYFLLWV